MIANGVIVEWDDHDKDVAWAQSRSQGTQWHRIERAGSMFPKCACTAGRNGRECGHIVALLECRLAQAEGDEMTSLRERLEGAEPEKTTAVARVKPPSVTEVAAARRDVLAMTAGGYGDALKLGHAMVAAKVAPDGVSPEQAAVIVMHAVELAIPPMQAFSYIAVIKGKPFLMARMCAAMVLRSGKGRIEQLERGPLRARARGVRGDRVIEVEITMDMAIKAGWVDKNPVYKSNPAAMLWARAVTTTGWSLFPDVLAGMDVAEGEETFDATVLDEAPGYAIVEKSPRDVEALKVADVVEGTVAEPPTEAAGTVPDELPAVLKQMSDDAFMQAVGALLPKHGATWKDLAETLQIEMKKAALLAWRREAGAFHQDVVAHIDERLAAAAAKARETAASELS